jgi:HD-GYP domain-containing protein (c-di-GMP phosphodiesterase class II)
MAQRPDSNFRRVNPADLRLGEPLPYAIYDSAGMLLLQAGFIVNTQKQIDVLIANGSYKRSEAGDEQRVRPAPRPSVATEERNSFEMLELLKIRMKRIFDHHRAGSVDADFMSRIEGIALTIQEACTHDTDAALANLHLDYDSSYAVVHHLQAAILCELVGRKLGIRDEVRLPLVKAGLTHDIGLLDIQDILDRQLAPLTPLQRERIERHPVDSERILYELGATEPAWLEPVRHHHERLDGSGYPDGCSGEAIPMPTRMLAIADIYSAMVRDRPYRKAMVSGEAMRKLMLEQGAQTDSRLIQLMIKEIGVFPPGAIVRLASGEIAVVKKRMANSTCPQVCAFVKPTGMPMLSPVSRDTASPGFAIEGMVPFSNYRGSIAVIRSLWN